MRLRHVTPSAGLGRWIHSYRQYTFAPFDCGEFANLPGTGAELWLPLSGMLTNGGRPVGDGLLCLRTRRIVFRQCGLRVFAIRFRAGALPFFTERPLMTLIDRYTPLDALWDESSARRLAVLRQTPDFEEQCLLADRILRSRLRAGARLENMQHLATVMYEESAGFALSDYAAQLCRDRSYLSRQFHEVHGTSAKYYHRLCRFERFLRDALYEPTQPLAGLAIDHGYYDQAHMNNDVRELSQQSPRLLLAREETRLFYTRRTALERRRELRAGALDDQVG